MECRSQQINFDRPYGEMIGKFRANNLKIVTITNLKVVDRAWFDYCRGKGAVDNNVVANVGWLKFATAEAACRFVADTNGMLLHNQVVRAHARRSDQEFSYDILTGKMFRILRENGNRLNVIPPAPTDD